MVQKFRESLQIGIETNFPDSMLTCPFFSKRAIVAKIYSRTDIFSDPDFKDLSEITTMPDHQSNKTCKRWDIFRYSRLLIVVREDEKSRPKIHCANNFFSASCGMEKQFLDLPLALHTSPYHVAAGTKFG